MNQDDYIVRRFHRDRQNPRMVVGTVKRVGEKKKMWFKDLEGLQRIMGVPRGQAPRRSRARGPGE